MILAVDIGNTNIKMALFKDKKILRTWRLSTDKAAGLEQYQKQLNRLFVRKKRDRQVDEIIICSVVPGLSKILKQALFLFFKKEPYVLGKDIFAPIKNLYKNPKQVGQDRLANAVAAYRKFGGAAIVVDFGTALTFDLISQKGSYIGGVIVPGMEISLQALIRHADLLPKIRLKRPRAILGRDTATSMQSGIVYGYSFLVESMLKRLKKTISPKAYVVATGGWASLMRRFCPTINQIEDNLTLEGLRLILEKRKKRLDKSRQIGYN
jgi:type III pantothenate kinase